MIQFPNSKINLGLHIVAKRPDGYHDIETVLYPVPFCDALEIIPAHDGIFRFTESGLPVGGETGQNLCVRAFHLLRDDFGLPAVNMHLHKVIPTGSGLGGGSSDGAFTLKMLNEIFSLGLDGEQLERYAGRLGSDCPFFIRNQPALAHGRGEQLEQVTVDLAGFYLVIAIPHVHVVTSDAYRMVLPVIPVQSLSEIILLPPAEWKGRLKNDFEGPVFAKFHTTGKILKILYEAGAIYASMSGSGSAIYGLFSDLPDTTSLSEHFCWMTRL